MMNRLAYRRVIAKHIKAMGVWCDRGDLDKAKAEFEQAQLAVDDLFDYTADRIKLQESRLKAKEAVKTAKKGTEDDVQLPEPTAKPKKKASPTKARPKKADS